MKNKLTYKEAFWWILLSISIISFPPYFYTLIYKQHFLSKGIDQKYNILAIAQIVEPGSQVLRTEQITSLLGFTKDQPKNLYLLDLANEEKKLSTTSLFTSIKLEKLLPSTLVVKYERRKPIAILGNLKDSGIDNEGVVFPILDVLPLDVPTLYVSEGDSRIEKWGEKLNPVQVNYFKEILLRLKTQDIEIVSIDISRTQAASLGSRELLAVLRITKTGKTFTARIAPENVQDSGAIVKQMLLMPEISIEGGEVVDLRVSPFGFFKGMQNS